jgi:hypothetical protein
MKAELIENRYFKMRFFYLVSHEQVFLFHSLGRGIGEKRGHLMQVSVRCCN